MRSTFAKIFLSFWVAEVLIAICTIFISIRQFESTAIAYTSSFSMMETLAKLSVAAYRTGGCTAMKAVPNRFVKDEQGSLSEPAVLFDPDGKPLCQQVDQILFAPAIAKIRKDGYLLGNATEVVIFRGSKSRMEMA